MKTHHVAVLENNYKFPYEFREENRAPKGECRVTKGTRDQ